MIRLYNNCDKEELVKLLKLNIPIYFAEEEEADFIEYLERHLETYFVFEYKGEIIGSGGLNFFKEDGFARISWDIVHPDYQGKGIGKQLLAHRIQHLKDLPAIESVQVRTSQLVYKFYEKMGFELERVEKDFWAQGFDLYQMHMSLKHQV